MPLVAPLTPYFALLTAMPSTPSPPCTLPAPPTRSPYPPPPLLNTTAGAERLEAIRRMIVNDTSRHRAKWEPPSTPAGFWNLGFPGEA